MFLSVLTHVKLHYQRNAMCITAILGFGRKENKIKKETVGKKWGIEGMNHFMLGTIVCIIYTPVSWKVAE